MQILELTACVTLKVVRKRREVCQRGSWEHQSIKAEPQPQLEQNGYRGDATGTTAPLPPSVRGLTNGPEEKQPRLLQTGGALGSTSSSSLREKRRCFPELLASRRLDGSVSAGGSEADSQRGGGVLRDANSWRSSLWRSPHWTRRHKDARLCCCINAAGSIMWLRRAAGRLHGCLSAVS